MGAYANLLEYGGREGMVVLSEISKRTSLAKAPLGGQSAALAKLLRIGRIFICTTLAVDKEKGYTDLSKRRVEVEIAAEKERAFGRAKTVHSVMWHVARKNEIDVEDLCKKVSWPLFRRHGDALGALQSHLRREQNLWAELDFQGPGRDLSCIADRLKKDIEDAMRQRLAQQRVCLRAKVAVSSQGVDGIDHVKEALLCGSVVDQPDCKLRIRLVAHPLFSVECTCLDRGMGMAALDEALGLIERSIRSNGGTYRLRAHPELPDQELVSDAESSGDDGGGVRLSGVAAIRRHAAIPEEEGSNGGDSDGDGSEGAGGSGHDGGG